MGESRYALEDVLSSSDFVFVDTCAFTTYYEKNRKENTLLDRAQLYKKRLGTHEFWIDSIEKSGVNGFGRIVVPKQIYKEIIPFSGNGYKKRLKSCRSSKRSNYLAYLRAFDNSQKAYRKLKRLILEKGLVSDSFMGEEYLGLLEDVSPYIERIQSDSLRRGGELLSEEDIDLFLSSLLKSFESRVALVSNDTKIRYLWNDSLRAGVGKEENLSFYHFVNDSFGKNFSKKKV